MRCPSTEEHQWCCSTCHEKDVALLYIRCLECCHPYRTRWHLLLAYRREWARIWWRDWRSCRRDRNAGTVEPGWGGTRWWHLLTGWWRPSRIPFCQCCIHDF